VFNSTSAEMPIQSRLASFCQQNWFTLVWQEQAFTSSCVLAKLVFYHMLRGKIAADEY